MRLSHKGVSEIIASRKREIVWRQHHPRHLKQPQQPHTDSPDLRIEALARKEHLGSEEKLQVLHQIERKYRISFTTRFPLQQVKWILVDGPTLIEKSHDGLHKSYYVLRGEVTAFAGGSAKGEAVRGETGFGLVFGDSSFKQCSIQARNAVILQIAHSAEHLLAIDRGILMTSGEKEQAVRGFRLFDGIDNLQKHYLPHFRPVRLGKGDLVYRRGDRPTDLFLIVEGEVSFESAVGVPHNRPHTTSLVDLIRQKRKEETEVTTEVLSEGSYFGEEEILVQSARLQNSRCNSISCLLLAVPLQKLQKLMNSSDLLASLQASSQQRQHQRSSKLEKYLRLRAAGPSDEASEQLMGRYEAFKDKMFRGLSEEKQREESGKNLSLGRQKHLVMHGYSVKMNRKSCETEPVPYSMLEVNQKTYSKTIKRFRHSLKELERTKSPKNKVEYGEGRSLLKVWHLLKLESVFDPEKDTPFVKIMNETCDGRESYESFYRLSKNIRQRHSTQPTRPRGCSSGCRFKEHYIRYLQNLG